MNRMRAVAKIVFVVAGIYIAINAAPVVLGLAVSVFSVGDDARTVTLILSNLFLVLVFAAVICYVLIGNREGLARYAVETDEQEDTAGGVQWVVFAYRLICVVAGVVFLYRCIASLGGLWTIYGMSKTSGFGSYNLWSQLLQAVLPIPCAVYLLAGAPHFVRWQVKKTLEACRGQTCNEEGCDDTGRT